MSVCHQFGLLFSSLNLSFPLMFGKVYLTALLYNHVPSVSAADSVCALSMQQVAK